MRLPFYGDCQKRTFFPANSVFWRAKMHTTFAVNGSFWHTAKPLWTRLRAQNFGICGEFSG
jgi:hypothetical protein